MVLGSHLFPLLVSACCRFKKKTKQVFATVYFMIMVLRSPHHIVYNNRKQQVS